MSYIPLPSPPLCSLFSSDFQRIFDGPLRKRQERQILEVYRKLTQSLQRPSGIGLGTAQRLIDEFLATRSLTSHLILIPTTRSATKSRDTIRTLRAYTVAAAQNPKPTLLSRAGGEDSYRWQDTVDRIHILSLTLDLCDLRGLYAFADALCRGTVSNPDGLEGEYLKNVRVPRLDSVICNAGFGGWSGINWGGLIISFFKKGFFELATYPDFKISLPTCILNERSSYNYVRRC